jgi:phage terminase small subunit
MAKRKGPARKHATARSAKKASPREPGKLTPKQERFVAEYLVDLNATQAAIRAGYASKRADAIGHENLRKPEIAEAITKAEEARAARTQITADRVLDELAAMAFSDIEHYELDDRDRLVLRDGAPKYAMRAVASIKRRTIPQKGGGSIREVEFRLWDKPGQLKLAGQHVGLFTKRVEVTGKDGGPIETKTTDVDLEKLSDADLAALKRIVAAQAQS